MKKALLVFYALLSISCLLIGCTCKHQWSDASCTTPRTCTICGETEGDPLPHTFSPATCTSPSICVNCGFVQGKPLPHGNITEANYQDAPMCLDCGTTLGTPLTPVYEEKNIPMNFQPGVPTPYTTICAENSQMTTTGTAILTDCGILDEADRAEWSNILGVSLEPQDGYEWIAAKIDAVFDDRNTQKYGIVTCYLYEDYYTPYLYDDTLEEIGEKFYKSQILWHGNTVEQLTATALKWGNWTPQKTISLSCYFAFRVPVGYRGAVVGLETSGRYINTDLYYVDDPTDGTLLYRLK